MNRPVIPAALLVVTLPVAVWHLFGDQTDYSDESLRLYFIWRAPGWLNELAHPIGLVSSLMVVAALIWLAVEYWLEHWRKWWFMALGSLCMLGLYAGLGGRYSTKGITEEDYVNVNGWLSLLSVPGVLALLFTMLCVAASKVRPESTARYLSKVGLKPTRRTAMGALLLGGLISAGLSLGIAAAKTVASPSQSLSLNESINLSVFFLPPLLFVGVVGLLTYLAIMALGLTATWLLLFRTADWIRKRTVYW
ncbi:hypothetical protein [Candidatus Poriferisocius sp.]|uniref:hypothetical protein n=1 Tax=Candidatus Poriferisocius sp. TaxID=3101276 RepID=UPI003B02E88B